MRSHEKKSRKSQGKKKLEKKKRQENVNKERRLETAFKRVHWRYFHILRVLFPSS